MKYRIVKFLQQGIDKQINSETGIHLGYKNTLEESIELVISEMSTTKFSVYEISCDDDLSKVVKRYTEISEVLKDRERIYKNHHNDN